MQKRIRTAMRRESWDFSVRICCSRSVAGVRTHADFGVKPKTARIVMIVCLVLFGLWVLWLLIDYLALLGFGSM